MADARLGTKAVTYHVWPVGPRRRASRRLFVVLAIALLLALMSGAAGQPNVSWNRTYGLSLEDTPGRIIESGDGGYVIVGTTNEKASEYDVYLLRIDRWGNEIWERRYGTGGRDEGLSVVGTEDGGFIVAGCGNAFPSNCLLLKVDGMGNMVWQKIYPSESELSDIAEIGGRYVAAGISARSGLYLLAVDADGTVLWEKTYGEAGWAHGILEASDGGFIVTADDRTRNGVAHIIHFDDAGEMIWHKTYENVSTRLMVRDSTSGYLAVGELTKPDPKGYLNLDMDIVLLRLDDHGEMVWKRGYDLEGWNRPWGAACGSDGSYIIGGATSSTAMPVNGSLDFNMFILNVDDEGNRVWTRTLEDTRTSGYMYSSNLVLAVEDGFLVVGDTITGGSDRQILLVRFGGPPAVDLDLSVRPDTVLGEAGQTVCVQATVRPRPGSQWTLPCDSRVEFVSRTAQEESAIYDDGTHGDEHAGDNTYSALAPLPLSLGYGLCRVTARITDGRGRTASKGYVIRIFPTRDEIIFREGIEEWSPVPISLEIDATCSAEHRSGSVSMAVTQASPGRIDFYPPLGYPFDTFGFEALELYINPGGCTIFNPVISVFMDRGLDYAQLDLKKLGYSFPQGEWTQIYVTLDFLQAANRSLDSIRLGGYAKGTYYVDDVRLVSMIGEGFVAGLFPILLFLLRFKRAGNDDKECSGAFSNERDTPTPGMDCQPLRTS